MDAQEAFTLLFKVAKYTGTWQDRSSTWAYRISGFLFHFIQTFMFTIFSFLNLFHVSDVKGVSDCLSIFLTMVALCIKIVNFVLNLQNFLILIGSLNDLIKFSECSVNKDHKRIKEQMRRSIIIYKAFAFFAILTIVLTALIPIFNWEEHRLGFPLYYPYIDYKNNDWIFATLGVYEMLTMLTALLDITLDTLPVIFMSYAVGLLEELADRLGTVGFEMEENQLDDAISSVEALRLNKISNADKLKELLKCIDIHLGIKQYIADTEKLFATIIMTQGVMSSLIICTTIFTMSLVGFLMTDL